MHRRKIIMALPLLAAPRKASADPAAGSPRLQRLFMMFIAPCCWRENLLVHDSPKAHELRTEIRRHVDAGWTDDQIKASFIKTYAKRILASPDGAQGKVLFWMPWVVTSAGAAFVTWCIHRSVRNRPDSAASRRSNVPDFDME